MSFVPAIWNQFGVRVLYTVLLAVASMVFFYDLGGPALMDYDEAAYARVVEETVASGNYAIPTIEGRPWFDKPPLYLMTLMASQALISDPEWAYRLPGVLFGMGSILLVMLIIYNLTRSHMAAVLGGAVLVSTSGFIEAAREVRFDVPLIFWMLLAWYATLHALSGEGRERTVWFVVMGSAVGFAFMTKSVVGIVPVMVIAPLVFTVLGIRAVKEVGIWYAALAAIVVAMPWHLCMSAKFGMQFWHSYLGVHVIERYSENLFGNAATNELYTDYLWDFGMPWIVLAPLLTAVVFLVRRSIDRTDIIRFFSFVVGGCMIGVLFYAAETKVVHYLVPLFPIVAITVGYGFHLIIPHIPTVRMKPFFILTGIIYLIGYGVYQTVNGGYRTQGHFAFDQTLANEEREIAALLMQRGIAIVYFTHDVYYETVYYYSRAQTLPASEKMVSGDMVVSFNDAPPIVVPHEIIFTGRYLRVSRIQ